MKLVRFAFYIAKFDIINVIRGKRKPHLVDDGISWWTWIFNPFTPGLSHMSVWIQDEQGYFDFVEMRPRHSDNDYEEVDAGYLGTCYTSTMRGDDNGTVSRPASTVFTNPKRWLYVEFEVTDESFEEAKKWADYRVKMHWSYSLGDLFRFVMPLWLLKKLKLDDPEREICSEHGEGWAIRLWSSITTKILLKILIRSPRRLWRDLVRRHHVATYSLATGKMVRDKQGKKV